MEEKMMRGDYIHKEHPKTRAESDFWGQVCRTVNGVAVSQDQIDMIVAAINKGLSLRPHDVLLDIGCGNGALSNLLFRHLSGFHGIDFSEYLIKIAKKYFEKPPDFVFKNQDGIDFVLSAKTKARYTKVLCYGAFTYFSHENSMILLKELYRHYPGVDRIFIGNLPDKDKSELFFKDKPYTSSLDDHMSATGIWRTKDQFTELAHESGWQIVFSHMPHNFYAAHYRYDATLIRESA